jgi:hypothetical protein
MGLTLGALRLRGGRLLTYKSRSDIGLPPSLPEHSPRPLCIQGQVAIGHVDTAKNGFRGRRDVYHVLDWEGRQNGAEKRTFEF